MKKEAEKVAIVKCNSYDQKKIDKAVIKVLRLAGIDIPKRKKVLIKPNVVGYFNKNQESITTHPAIIESICKLLKKNNCKIYIGDSSFTDSERAFRKLGIEKIANKYGKLVIFEQDRLLRIKDNHTKILDQFYLPKTLKDVDIIINLPKLKTHQLAKYTGAIKNLYGCIPGGMKQKFHKKAQNEKNFSKLLVDVYQNIKPEINIMDAVIGMEGEGPTSGKLRKAGYILASKSAVSLDIVSSKLMGYNPKSIPVISEAVKRKLGRFAFKLISEGNLKKVPNLKFKKPIVHEKIPKKILKMFRQREIIVDVAKCIKCGLCARKCPGKAIVLKPYPQINKKKCIRCFCCMEICPQHALHLK